MGVSTQGIIITDNKDVFLVHDCVAGGLYYYLSTLCPDGIPAIERMKNLRVDSEIGRGYIVYRFKPYGQDSRQMFLHFNCDKDCQKISTKQKLVFSLGCYGEASAIIKAVGNSLKHMGEFWFCENDCSDKWEKIL